jgi:RNA polymerase sigma-70 factor (ECF subfamily)
MDDVRPGERELVDAVLANRPGAFARLVREYQGLCWHLIQRMVRNPEDARELCQDTFLRVHQSLHQYRYESALKSWIARIAWNIALRHLQRKRIPLVQSGDDDETNLIEQVGDGFDLEAACADQQIARHLHAAIDQLSPLQRSVLTLYHLEEMTIPEIARMTGLATGTIKSHLFRARLRLRGELEARLGVAA